MALPALGGVAVARATAPPIAPRPSFGAALRASAAHPPPCAAALPAQSPARIALAAIEGARARLDGAIAAARSGQTFRPQELLALQADAYRYSQTVDLASKVVEAGVSTIKQAVNTQV